MKDVAEADLDCVCLSVRKQDCVTIDPPDTVLLRPPSLSLLPRLSVDKSLPQVGQHFQFSKVGVFSWRESEPGYMLVLTLVCGVGCFFF